MGFSYEKYNEIINRINSLVDILNEPGEEGYMSFKVQDTLCRVIQEANRVNTYIRHYKNR